MRNPALREFASGVPEVFEHRYWGLQNRLDRDLAFSFRFTGIGYLPPGFIIPLVLGETNPNSALRASLACLSFSLNRAGLFCGVSMGRKVRAGGGRGS